MINIDFQDINIMEVAEGGSGGADLSNYYTKNETDTKLAAKADKTAIPDISTLASKTELNTKVDKVTGKQLSTNDYTTVEKNKLAGLVNYDDTAIKQQITNLETSIGSINTMLDNINGEVI
jgi:uncharacterized protein YkwD